ncbi:unnamed protein product, partial [Amoebophrya sp. A25]
ALGLVVLGYEQPDELGTRWRILSLSSCSSLDATRALPASNFRGQEGAPRNGLKARAPFPLAARGGACALRVLLLLLEGTLVVPRFEQPEKASPEDSPASAQRFGLFES